MRYNVLQWLQAVLIQLEAFNKPILASAVISGSVLLQWRAFAQIGYLQRTFWFFCFKPNCSPQSLKGVNVSCLHYHICNQFIDLFQ